MPPPLFAADDRNSFLLLLAPVFAIFVALAATRALAPHNAFRNLERLPPIQTLAAPSQPISATAPLAVAAATVPLAPLTPGAPRRAERLAPTYPPQPAATLPAEPRPADAGPEVLTTVALSDVPPRSTVPSRPAPQIHLGKCSAPPAGAKLTRSPPPYSANPATFGLRLARAARAQTRDLVVYSERYRQIGYPMGDIPAFYGVCTDVVVRAYRALGMDLQVLVHNARIGTGDTSIDHRRTQTLRRFFARFGVSLPVTDFVEDYKPGDIVTYHRASGRTSQSHIAIVSDVVAPSGRPMIVHNRGWGPQLEDALFASTITGHFRFTAMPAGPPANEAATPAPAPKPHAGSAAAQDDVRLSENAAR
jgi:uncharacterized protein YijF (DUF1287 family)